MGKICRRCIMSLLAILAPVSLAAQSTGTVQGSVVDAATQQPLTGVQVHVVGSALRTLTSAEGRFMLVGVPAGERTIRAELIGYAAQQRRMTVPSGAVATVEFSLSMEAVALEGLVVTALGLERSERSLTTSSQRVVGAELIEARETNLVTALSGKVAGVQITNSNTAGGSARIVIRGANSLTGGNQPLFVVDGIPVSNAATTGGGSMGYNAIDYGNAIQDIDPSDIEAIDVLKGPNAAALYGSRGANGVILITTTSGRRAGGSRITASSNITFETPLKLPTYQNKYGQGTNGQYSYVDGRGGGTYDNVDESWGPRLDAGLMIPQFFSNGEPAPWVSHPNNVRDVFETGRTAHSNVSFATNSENSNVRFSVSRMDQDGMYPGFRLERTNLSLKGGSTLTERLRTDASVQYIKQEGQNRPAQGYGADNFMFQFLWFGRQVDTGLLREQRRNPDGTQFNWNSVWNNNPYWTALENGNRDGRDRIIGSASVSYEVMPWLSATLRTGTDWSQQNRRQEFAAGTFGQSDVDDHGAFGTDDVFRQETNTDLLLSATLPAVGPFDVNVDFGGNRRDNEYRSSGVYVRDLVVPGIYNLDNAAVTPSVSDYRERQRVNSLYGQARLSFRDLWFVDVTGRNDWSSTLPADNNSYFYPSVSSSLIFTELLELPGVSFGKLRAGWTQVGSDAPPYQLVDPYVADVPFGDVPRFTASNRLRNANLKPESTESWEVGADLRFLDDRFGVQFAYYGEATTNQIVPVQISPITGFTERMINAGKISSRGVEVMAEATPVRLANGFEWSVAANFSRDRTQVDELYGDLETIVLGDYYGVTVEARKGERYGAMYGRQYVRDSQGKIVVGSNGLPLNSGSNPIGLLGNYNPDWVGGLSNRLAFRAVELSVLVDVRRGGSIYSMTNRYGRRSGVLIETLEGRETAHALADGGGMVVDGVRVVGGDTVPNDIVVTAQSYHRSLSGIAEEFVYDASFIKLRELRVGYTVPSSLAGRFGLRDAKVALVGRNLWLKSDAPHIDPETAFNASNVQGFEYSQMPSARSIGFHITVTP